MDILYIIGKFSRTDNFELRCSLRSIEKYGQNVGNIYVVGYCPEWLSDEVTKIPFEQPYQLPSNYAQKTNNIMASIKCAIENSDIGDDFLVSMDDHFYVRPTDFNNYPYYVREINDTIELPQTHDTPYHSTLANTRKYLESKGLPTINFTLHRNMHVSRGDVIGCEKYVEEILKNNIECESLVLFNNYHHMKNPVDFVKAKDVKLQGPQQWHKTDPQNTECFSTVDFGKGMALYTLIGGLYDKKSKYEK